MRLPRLTRTALLTVILAVGMAVTALAATASPEAASAKRAQANASAQLIAKSCAKRAKRLNRRIARAKRRAARKGGGAVRRVRRAARKRRRAAKRRCASRLRSVASKARGNNDVFPPSVSWTAPAEESTVSGLLDGPGCEAEATDNHRVANVVFAIDGTVLNADKHPPYRCSFDTTGVADGLHVITATAYDQAGNANSASRTVEVSNQTAPEPEPDPEEPEPDPDEESEESEAGVPPWESTSGSLAIGIDGGHDNWWSATITARAALGAAVTRHEWDPTEPVDARDALVLAATTEVQTRIHALLGNNHLGDPTHYRDWVVAFVARYGPGGSFWDEHPELDEARYAIASIELGNEPYFGAMTAAEYADTVRPALERIAELGLPVKVILASRSYGGNTSWVDTLYERIPDLNSLFYAFAAHPYWYGHHPAEPGPAGPFERIGTLRRRMDEHGASGKPIYITEYGQSTANCGSECVDEATQAEHLKAMVDAVVSRDEWKVELLSIFQLHDWATNSTNREQQFGLLRHDGSQKPSYAIVREAMQQHRG